MVWRWRKFRFNQVDGEAIPGTRRTHPNTVKMFVNSMSLERWESESNIREHGTTFGIKTVRFQMIPRYADKARSRGRKRVIFEYLAVQTTRQELHADLITFDFCERGAGELSFHAIIPFKEIKGHTGIFLISPLSALFLYGRKAVYKSACRTGCVNGSG